MGTTVPDIAVIDVSSKGIYADFLTTSVVHLSVLVPYDAGGLALHLPAAIGMYRMLNPIQ